MSNPFLPPLPDSSHTDRIQWGNLLGCASSVAIANASLSQRDRSSLIVVPTIAVADRLARDLALLCRGRENTHNIVQFADWETLPYDNFSPHQDIISERMRCLYQLSLHPRNVVIVSATTLLQRLPPEEHVIYKSLLVNIGDTLDRESFRANLVDSGYNKVDTVYQHGEFALRGALIDVYPMGSRAAYRIELFDDIVESVRQFDPETQRTIEKVDVIELLPANECPLDETGLNHFRQNWHKQFDVDHRNCPVYQDVLDGISPAGVEYYLPLFFPETASLFDYLPAKTLVFLYDGVNVAIEDYWRELSSRYDNMNVDPQRPLLAPKLAFHQVEAIFSKLKNFPRVIVHPLPLPEKMGNTNFLLEQTQSLLIDYKAKRPLQGLDDFLCSTAKRVVFCAESNGRKETLKEQLAKIGVVPDEFDCVHAFVASASQCAITVADFAEGLNCTEPALVFIAESQIFGVRVQQQRRRKSSRGDDPENIVKNLTELKLNAPVVHVDNGVGRYKGLQTIEVDGRTDEFLVLLYADDAKLYVPVANLHLISRYSGADDEHAPLHKLGSDKWQRAKRKAAEKVRDVAAELLDIYAKRKARQGYAYTKPKDDYLLFSDAFPFEETPDQQDAISAVIDDMLAPQPMDRLVCGDVGFGKTEVAMRAAFIAVQNSKQVAVLVPTTLLAQQHYENFKDRFADWPVTVEVMSRFSASKSVESVKTRLKSGAVDIVVGTHKLIQSDISFDNLGLLIIDEEHRFGVRQKEKLKALRAEVDILTMTATPIPRTLNMSMAGIRDLSIIATPPAKRLSIKTFVRESDDAIIKEAVQREIMRGGQVYYLHNEVKTIEKVASDLAELVPEARVAIGHGQMRERVLETVMSDFYHKRFNVLVCTTIIETGIDVPSANTIVIDRADKFGLAQLHQLRGRVGRSHHQAYAYLLTPNKRVMSADAVKRLDAIVESSDLGAGFMLASHDMEIRGAGELLGDDQSGQMHAIGFSLYMDMLDRAVKAIDQGQEVDFSGSDADAVEINLRIPALLPDDYVPDVHTRLTLYKRLSAVSDETQLYELQIEMIDRFGLLPKAAKNLLRQTQLRLFAQQMGISKIETNKAYGCIEFSSATEVDPMTIVNLVQKQPQNYRLEGANQLRFNFDLSTSELKLTVVSDVLEKLGCKV